MGQQTPRTVVTSVIPSVPSDAKESEARQALVAELRAALSEWPRPLGSATVGEIWGEQMRIREAFAKVLRWDGPFAAAFAGALIEELPGSMTAREAGIAVSQVMTRRAKDQERWLELLQNDGALLQSVLLPAPPPATGLSPRKLAELTERMSQVNHPLGPEPVVHVLANIDAQRRWHLALAHCWQPGNLLHSLLLGEVHSLLPDVRREAVQGAVQRFLTSRYNAAIGVVAALEPGGPVVHQALAQSLGQGKHPTQNMVR